MAGPFDGHGIDIQRKIEEEEIFHDPYIQLLLQHLRDPKLFDGKPEDSRNRQQELLLPFLDFFLRHDRDGYYAGLFRRKALLENSSEVKLKCDITLGDLVKLRIHSDDLRGDGQQKRLIREIDLHHLPPGSQVHCSSGTTQNTDGPVTLIRSPMSIQLERLVNGELVKWAFGSSLDGGYCLLQMAPEMTDFMTFASFAADVMQLLGCKIVFGNTLRRDDDEPNVWRRLEPDRCTLKKFFTSKRNPKILMTGSAGLFNTLANPSLVKRLAIKVTMGVPPIDLGEGGILMTGGGLKRVPARYETMQDFIVAMAPAVIAGLGKKKERAPVMDFLGLTESASVFVNQAADPLEETAWIKYPHPLTYVTMLESPQNLVPQPTKEFDKSRLLFFVNFSCVDYLEAIVSGDFVKRVQTPSCHQHGFIYDRRASTSEGFQTREGCG